MKPIVDWGRDLFLAKYIARDLKELLYNHFRNQFAGGRYIVRHSLFVFQEERSGRLLRRD